MKFLLILLCGACFGGNPAPEDVVYNVDCIVFATCGPTGDGIEIPLVGTKAEVSYLANTWVDACAVVTHEWVTSGRCVAVFCGAFCEGDNQ